MVLSRAVLLEYNNPPPLILIFRFFFLILAPAEGSNPVGL